MGAFQVKQPLPTQNVPQISPFLLLNHFGFKFIIQTRIQKRVKPLFQVKINPLFKCWKRDRFKGS
ncbi:MAG: hypothetical protein EBS35_04645 [Bacteroidetes bacterium]|nr:hypothetical protein [Bacteroidota bacterium]